MPTHCKNEVLVAVLGLASLIGCTNDSGDTGDDATGESASSGGDGATGGETESGGGPDGNGSSSGGSSSGGGGDSGDSDGKDVDPGWEGPCPESLADRLRITPIPAGDGKRNGIPAVLDRMRDGGARLAWPNGGEIKLVRLDATEQIVGPVAGIEGVDVGGIVAHEDGAAMLIFREPDMMDLVRVDDNGATLFETTMIGNNDHEVVGSKYVRSPGNWHHSRLRWVGGRYAAYLAHHQRWSDGISHQGDLLWYYDEQGNRVEQAWDWGCSHSLAVHMTVSDGIVFTTCDSDGTYGGIGLNASRNLVPGVAYGGDIVPVDGGIVTAFSRTSGMAGNEVGIIHVAADLNVGPELLLPPVENVARVSVHMAPYGNDRYLIGWVAGSVITPVDSFGAASLAIIDGQGTVAQGPESIPIAFDAREDFVVMTGGDVGWVGYPTENASTWPLEVVRMRRCN